MYSKYKFKKLVAKISPEIIEVLRIKSKTIHWHYYNSTTKKFKAIKLNYSNQYGLTCRNNRGADIVIFCDKHHSKSQAIGTIIHELLHVRLGDLADLVTIGCDQAARIEECIVSRLEKLLIKLYI